MIAALLLALQPAPAAAAAPDLGWLAGYWLSCADGRETSETWSDRRGGVMLGSSLTRRGERVGWEQMRIEESDGRLAFVAQPQGAAAPTVFPLVRSGPGEAVFENPQHDFPQRVIYRRDGDSLTGRIEGRTARGESAAEWRYRAAPLNQRCPD